MNHTALERYRMQVVGLQSEDSAMGHLTSVDSIGLTGELPECSGEMRGSKRLPGNANDMEDWL